MNRMWIKTLHENYINSRIVEFMEIEFDGRRWVIKAWIGTNPYKIEDNFETAVEARQRMEQIILNLEK